MKLWEIIATGILGLAIGHLLVKLIWGEPSTFNELFPKAWFLIVGILGGWYLRKK